jgi:superfamily II DNA or RNA helicase
MYGYIYVRDHYSYDKYDLYKLGKTINIPDRDSNYITSEPVRGEFKLVLELPIKTIGIIEKLLQNEFQNLHCKFNGGSEFYKREIINKIEPYLNTLNLKYRVLTKQEIDSMLRKYRAKKELLKYVKEIKRQPEPTQPEPTQLMPRDDQEKIINKSVLHFQDNAKGLLVVPCGAGKTLLSLWIVQKLNLKTVLIGVPNLLLLKQWESKTKYIFRDVPHFIIAGGITENDLSEFLKVNNKNCIIITTYMSSNKVLNVSKLQNFTFDIKINDECHHLTSAKIDIEGQENQRDLKLLRMYKKMLSVPSIKQLSLTATLKNVSNCQNEPNIISNDNIEQFGNIIIRKSLLWAIKKNIVCDYVIQTILFEDDALARTAADTQADTRNTLYLAAYAALKSISNFDSHHLLIYSNNKKDSEKIIRYVNELLESHFKIKDIFVSSYHSDMKSSNRKKILSQFDKFKFGIIACVHCLGEGWDFPKLDGVVFADVMFSKIRIVQAALRASRKNNNEPNKITKIILPISTETDTSDFKKVKEVIYQMGLEDKTISQKIKAFKITKNDHVKQNKISSSDRLAGSDRLEGSNITYDEELTEKIKLHTVRRSMLDMTYAKAKSLLAKKNIKSKDEYYNLCDNDNRFSKEPDVLFKDTFKNWIDYFSIERRYYELDICKKKINEYLAKYPDLKKHYLKLSIITNKLNELDPLFPPSGLWEEYYNVKEIREIIIIKNNKEARKINRIK